MMTLNDYLQRVQTLNIAWDRTSTQLVFAGAQTMLVLGAAVWILSVGAAPGWIQALMLLPLIVCFVLNMATPPQLWHNLDIRVGLVCPTCNGSLFRTQGRLRVHEVVETGKCPTCYADVFPQPYTPPAVHHPTVATARSKKRISARQAVFLIFVIVFSWTARAKLDFDYCNVRYAEARTAEDSAAVDRLSVPLAPSSPGAGHTVHRRYCRNWRAQDGTKAVGILEKYASGTVPAPPFTKSSVWLLLVFVGALLPPWRALRLARRPV